MRLPDFTAIWQKRSWWWMVAVLAAANLIFGSLMLTRYVSAQKQETVVEVQTTYGEVKMLDLAGGVPVIDASAPTTLNLSATAALAFDLTDKTILFEKNGTQVLYPASTTKMVTALVVRDIYQLDDQITITGNDLAFDNVIGLRVGETLTIYDLLKALLIRSSNESALALAFHSPNGYVDFVEKMNQKVVDLGLKAHFANPAGFDDPGQQASAYDLAIIAEALLMDPVLAEVVASAQTPIAGVDDTQTRNLTTTNQLLRAYTQNPSSLPYSVFGVKTGTTNLAQEALVTGIDLNGHRILIVVLGARNRYNDTQVIADYIIDNVSWQTE